MKEGWELIKDQYWLFLGITVVGILIGSFIPFGLGLGAMYCGIYYTMLQKMNNKPFEFGDLFKGFNHFVPAMIATMIFIVPVVVFTLVSYASLVGVMLSAMDSRGKIDESAIFVLYGVLFTEGIIFAVLLSCIHVFIMFVYPLIVERNMDGWSAFKLSARAGWANLSGVVGLILAEFLMGLIGYMVCFVGLYFVFPVMFAGVLVAYRKVFPIAGARPAGSAPPPPNAYQAAGNWQ